MLRLRGDLAELGDEARRFLAALSGVVEEPSDRRLGAPWAAEDPARLLGILGHELRNPLSAINALARVTGQREDLATDVRERLVQIERAAARSLAMVESLLDFSESRWKGSLATHPVLAEPVEIAARVIEELRAAHPERIITLEVQSRAPFELDPMRIQQVLVNLIGNALVHGSPDTPVEVSVDVRAEEASLAVRNRGPVIPREQLASLFQPFTQGPASIAHPRGLGLGLYIVRESVAAHAGDISVDSTEGGTTFRVRLPRR